MRVCFPQRSLHIDPMLQRKKKKKKGSPLAGPHLRPGSVSLLKHTGVRPGGEGRAVSPTQRPFRKVGGLEDNQAEKTIPRRDRRWWMMLGYRSSNHWSSVRAMFFTTCSKSSKYTSRLHNVGSGGTHTSLFISKLLYWSLILWKLKSCLFLFLRIYSLAYFSWK